VAAIHHEGKDGKLRGSTHWTASADAIVMMRFDSSEIGNTMSEIVAYGTAVVVVPDAGAVNTVSE
jgi:hypothetical protein